MAGTATALILDRSGGSRTYRDFLCLEMAGTANTLISGHLSQVDFVRRSNNKPQIGFTCLYIVFLSPD